MSTLYDEYSMNLNSVDSALKKGLNHKSWYDATKTTGNSTHHTFYYSNIT